MESAQQAQSAQQTRRLQASIAFDDWKARIQMANDVDQLVRLVRAYLSSWTAWQLKRIPYDLASAVLAESEDIVARAVIASRAELQFTGPDTDQALLREMALTYAASATRLRFLRSRGGPVK